MKAHLEVEPNFVEPLARMLMEFEMPGADMPDYAVRDAILRREGVFSPSHFYSMVVDHLWREWISPACCPRPRRRATPRSAWWSGTPSWGASPPAALRLERAATRGVTMASPRACWRGRRRQGSAPAEPSGSAHTWARWIRVAVARLCPAR